MANSSCILFFIKSPDGTPVKSRLADSIGAEPAALVYKKFVHDTIRTLQSLPFPFRTCYFPAETEEAVRAWLGDMLSYMPQQGKDLGDRMESAFRAIFSEGCSRAILIGSDVPDLPPEILTEALESLETHDAVIGPSIDGGYYLIGFRKETFLPDIFRGRTWSTNTVFRETLHVLNNSGYHVHRVSRWQDVDTIEDLRSLLVRNRDTFWKSSETMTYLIHNQNTFFRDIEPVPERKFDYNAIYFPGNQSCDKFMKKDQ